MSIKKNIPNAITLLNLFSGCLAVYFACVNQLFLASFFSMLGIFFDFFDGFFARMFNANSELGLQLDSLADMVTSGVVPGVLMFQLLKQSNFINAEVSESVLPTSNPIEWLSFLGFAITLASCYRLANFNIDTLQTSSFIGLPTPANTLMIISVALIQLYQPDTIVGDWLSNIWVLLSITALSCYLLNAEIPLFALKFKEWSFKNNWVRYILIVSSVILISVFTYSGILATIILYVLLSIVFKDLD